MGEVLGNIYDKSNNNAILFEKINKLEKDNKSLQDNVQRLLNKTNGLKQRIKELEDKLKESEDEIALCDSKLLYEQLCAYDNNDYE